MQRALECTGGGYRRLLWRIPAGTSIRTILEEEEVATDTDHTPRPISIIETEEKLWNSRRYICAVLQCSTTDGDIINDYKLYGKILNDMVCNEDWCCIGEVNKEDIFHTHVLAKTGVRIDSWKRTLQSVWKNIATDPAAINNWGSALTIDCLKGQTAHKPMAIFQYMCKNPIWILSNVHRMLQMAGDIIHWDLCARFRTAPEVKPNIDQANPIVKEILDIIVEKGCKTLEDLMRSAPEVMVKHLHRPGFGSIAQNCLTFAKCTAAAWSIEKYGAYDPDPGGIHSVLLTQGISPTDFDRNFYAWVTKQHPKRNTFQLIGPSNTGKTSLIAGFGKCCPGGEIQNGLTFNFESLVGMYWGKWDEPMLAPEVVEKFKQIAGGEDTHVTIKFKKPAPLKRTPIFVTTNFPLWRWCEDQRSMLENRMISYRFKYDVSNGRFIPRTSEPSCKCGPCTFSCERSANPSIATTSGMQSTKRSKTCSEQLAARDAKSSSNVASGSMRGTTESYGQPDSTVSSGIEQSCDSTSGGGTSTTTSRKHRFSDQHGSGDSHERMGHTGSTGTGEHVVRHTISGGSMAGDMGGIQGQGTSREYGGGHSGSDVSLSGMVSMGGTKRKKEEMVLLQTRNQQMDNPLETLLIPDKNAWMKYLSHLYHTYVSSQGGTDLRCYESLSDTSDSE
uniref:Nonstructural protein n=1 Tax=Parvoviridae sp. TaxID=1940570 RepID=A0A7D3QPN5_9VIRU|nr:MAG: nonstructural protein [Parvoviridae sp.]